MAMEAMATTTAMEAMATTTAMEGALPVVGWLFRMIIP